MYRFMHITAPGVVPTRLQIVKIALVGVCLALKRDVTVSVAFHWQPHQPLDEISDIEEHKEHLALLRRVDALMIDQFAAQVNAMMHE